MCADRGRGCLREQWHRHECQFGADNVRSGDVRSGRLSRRLSRRIRRRVDDRG
ncbi:MAG TPA: hypothetical protein VMV92_21230 [Streptosporangiaceae bacterium]|nr:hypothetical protein [Streptosporangiaceae bacterium]